MRESEVVRAVKSYLDMRGFWYWRNNVGATVVEGAGRKRFFRYGVKGMPDFTVRVSPTEQVPSGVIWIECKSTRGKLTLEQRHWMGNCRAYGDAYLVVRTPRDIMFFLGGYQKPG